MSLLRFTRSVSRIGVSRCSAALAVTAASDFKRFTSEAAAPADVPAAESKSSRSQNEEFQRFQYNTSRNQSNALFLRRSPLAQGPSVCQVKSPYNGEVVLERKYASDFDAYKTLSYTSLPQRHWRATTLEARKEIITKFIDYFLEDIETTAAAITREMGKPLQQARNEVNGLAARCRAFVDQAEAALAPQIVQSEGNFERSLVRDPVGTVVVIAPWNYPLLTACNVIVPALLAGNAVVLKASPQTPSTADAFVHAFEKAGLPRGLFTSLFVNHATFERTVIPHPAVGYISFTGSVDGGRSVYQAVANQRLIDVGLELGGKDGMYVAEDADLESAVANAVDGACYNAGQSCCAVERVFVHKSLYEPFLEKAAALMKGYKLGDPTDPETNMGPLTQVSAKARLSRHVEDAKKKGARVLVGGSEDPRPDLPKSNFFAPTLIADCTHSMSVMREENFGPILAVAPVEDDQDALRWLNGTRFGLTASIWTSSVERVKALAPRITSGTVFMNRCDYLDPYLAWAGRRDSGKGASMGHLGFDAVTKPKSLHFKLNPNA